MWVTKLLISPVKKRVFCSKTTKFGPKLAFLVDLGQAMQAYSMPCCRSVGGCGARVVSRKTPIYFIYDKKRAKGSPYYCFYRDSNCLCRQKKEEKNSRSGYSHENIFHLLSILTRFAKNCKRNMNFLTNLKVTEHDCLFYM